MTPNQRTDLTSGLSSDSTAEGGFPRNRKGCYFCKECVNPSRHLSGSRGRVNRSLCNDIHCGARQPKTSQSCRHLLQMPSAIPVFELDRTKLFKSNCFVVVGPKAHCGGLPQTHDCSIGSRTAQSDVKGPAIPFSSEEIS